MNSHGHRDLIVVGTSLGGLQALEELVRGLPPDLNADVLIVQHMAATSAGRLAGILDRLGTLSSSAVRDFAELGQGRILVAPPDRHLVVTPEGARAVFGPRENRARPAIDPLFRTAAVVARTRVIGVILTGLLSDGAAGLQAVKRCGGLAIVQDPDDASHDEMPRHALDAVSADHVVPAASIGPLLGRLTRDVAPAPPDVPDDLRVEARLTMGGATDERWRDVPSRQSMMTCPDCGGGLAEIGAEANDPDPLPRYRCHVGHAFTAHDLLDHQSYGAERALWVALRILEENTAMLERLSRGVAANGGASHAAESYERRVEENRSHAQTLRQLLRRTNGAS